MERLTYRNKNGNAHFAGDETPVNNFKLLPVMLDRLAEYEDIGSPEEFRAYKETYLTPQEFYESADFVLELNKKLKPYVDAVQQKRCVLFPCAIGETIYFIDGSWVSGKLMYRSNRGFEIVEVQFDPRTMWNFEKNTFVSHYFLTEKEAQEFIELNTDGAVKFFGSQARLRKNKL